MQDHISRTGAEIIALSNNRPELNIECKRLIDCANEITNKKDLEDIVLELQQTLWEIQRDNNKMIPPIDQKQLSENIESNCGYLTLPLVVEIQSFADTAITHAYNIRNINQKLNKIIPHNQQFQVQRSA